MDDGSGDARRKLRGGKPPVEPAAVVGHAALQQTVGQGLPFRTGSFKMACGNSMLIEQQTIDIDAESGKGTEKFKLPNVGKQTGGK